jgi:hypothetical protein
MCERWDKSRGLWVKLQETNYSVFVSGFLEDLNAKQLSGTALGVPLNNGETLT